MPSPLLMLVNTNTSEAGVQLKVVAAHHDPLDCCLSNPLCVLESSFLVGA